MSTLRLSNKKINNVAKEKQVINFPEPKNPVWIGRWKKKVKKARLKWTLIFISAVLLLAIFIILLITDKEVTTYGSYTKPIWMIFVGITSFIVIIVLALWLAALITIKVRIRQYDGYTVLVLVSFKDYLVVENVVQDFGITNRFLYGQLPNKKQVWVEISAWDGSVKMGVGKDGDEKNLL